ncbi:MAG: hypothetical protein OHK0046_11400 [Anaerolineae bacterium]
MNKVTRFIVLCLVLLLTMSLGLGVVTAQDESVLVIGFEQEPPNLWPLNNLVFGGLPESFYARDLWDWDENREIFPILAAEVPSIEAGSVVTTEEGDTAVTVTLREGLQWSDGTPITSADCEVWHTIRSDTTTSDQVGRGTYPDSVKSFEIVDDLTFTITYNGAFPDFLAANEKPECRYPAHVFGPMIADGGKLEESTYFTTGATVAYGPYALTEWNIGQNMVLTRNEFWQGEEPAWDRVIIQFITDDTQMRNSLEVGDIDMAFNWSDDLNSVYAAIDGVETFAAPGVFADALWIRSGEIGNSPDRGGEALMNSDVRQAIAHAIPRRLFAELLVGPGIEVPTSWYPPALWPEDLGFLEYDIAGARALLDGAGWMDDDGDEPAADAISPEEGCAETTPRVNAEGIALDNLRFVTTENTLRNNYQLVIQTALNCVGISTDIAIIPATTLFAAFPDRGTLTNSEFELAIFANSANALAPTGDASSYQCSGIPSADNPDGFNGWQFCNERYDEVDNLINSTLPGPERDALIAEAVTLKWEGHFWHGLRLRATWFAVDSTTIDTASVQANVGTLASNWFNQVEFWEPAGM